MTAIAAALRNATTALQRFSQTPRLDAELLMAHALGLDRSELLLKHADLIVPDCFAGLIARRMADEPVAYITGYQHFWDLKLAVTPDVLIPRADSETLIEAAMAASTDSERPQRLLDLGTGSGALLLAALSVFPQSHGTGIDASAAALEVARNNAQSLAFDDRAEFRHLSWHDPNWTIALGGPFDLILCNPPYVEELAQLDPMVAAYEPHSALFAGPDGLDDYRVLIPVVPALLAPHGMALFEIGYRQTQAVTDLAISAGLITHMHRDLAGNPRCLRFSLGIGK